MLLGTHNLLLNVNINLLHRAVNYALGAHRLALRVPHSDKTKGLSQFFVHLFFIRAANFSVPPEPTDGVYTYNSV